MILELERFLAVVSEGSFTKAAKKVFITQPALSLSIIRLEEVLGVKLFKRIGKKFILTKDGELVFQVGSQILKLWLKIKDPNFRQQINKPLFSLGLYDNAALKLSKYFQKELAEGNFRFEITIDRSESLMRGIQAGIFDLCVCIISPEAKLEKEVFLIKTFEESLLPVSSKIWKGNLNQTPFILYNKESTTRIHIDRIFLKQGINPQVIVESTDTSFMKELALGGGGVALLPKNFVERELRQKKLFIQKFPFTFQRKIGLFLSKGGKLKASDEIVNEITKMMTVA